MIEQAHHTVPIFLILLAVTGGLVGAAGTTLLVYKCYQRFQSTSDEKRRLSTSIHSKSKRCGAPDRPATIELTDRGLTAVGTSPTEQCHLVTEVARQPADNQRPKSKLGQPKLGQLKPGQPKLGQLHFETEYDPAKCQLEVRVIKATDLPPKNPASETADPYVKLQLLPDKKQNVKTRVLRKTRDPVYDEVFVFYGVTQVLGLSLHFAILNFDRFSRDDIIGEIVYPLTDEKGGKQALCIDIQPRRMKVYGGCRGELLLSLCYQPSMNRLTAVVLKAKNLPKLDVTGLSDPYVKLYLKCKSQRICKKKSHVKKSTLNPVFNESFLFDVPPDQGLEDLELEVELLEWDKLTKNEVIGRTAVGLGQGGLGAKHWRDVMDCPRKQVAEWHKLTE